MTKRKKFGSKAAKAEAAAQEAGSPTTFSDEFIRCKRCFCSKNVYGQPNVPTLMVRDIIRLRLEDKPNVDLGSVIRCGNADCNYIHEVSPFRAAAEHGITKNEMLLAVASQKGAPSFTLEEFKANRPPYNPNAHIEPKHEQESLPL